MTSKYATTAELAAMLDRVQSMPASNTKYLLDLKEATMRLAYAYPRLEPAQRSFANEINGAWGVSQFSAEWEKIKEAAKELAILVRTLGNIKITLCTKQNKFGQCDVPLTPEGRCNSPIPHRS